MSQLARRSHLHPAPIVPASDEGSWAPCRTRFTRRPRLSKRECACACIDSLGYHRAKHTLDGDGKCIFDCDGRVR